MPDDPLIENYRQASAQDASQPSDATRATIAARARELVAQRRDSAATAQFDTRVPAANQSSWKIRAVAGLAVLAVGGSLFWQTYRDYPEQLTTTVAVVPAPATAPPAEPAADAAEQKVENDAARRQAAQPPAQLAESKASAAREEAHADAAAAAPAASRQASGALRTDATLGRARPDAADIMARYFSDALITGESNLWVLLDARGAVLRTGRQAPADPAVLKRYLEARYPRIVTAEVETEAADTQRGTSLIHFVWLATGSPLPTNQEGAGPATE